MLTGYKDYKLSIHRRKIFESLLDIDMDKGGSHVERDWFPEGIENYITTNSSEVVEVILKSKIDINHIYPNGLTVLHIACRRGFSRLVEHLLLHGASSMIEDSQHCLLPLHICAQEGSTACIEVLLLYKARICVVHRLTGKLPLHFAAQSGSEAAFKLLLSADNELSSINATDYDGHTPLHLAVIDGNADIVRLLLRHGCDTSLKDCNGKTAFDLAQMVQREDIIRNICGDLFAGMRITSPVLTRYLSPPPPDRWVGVIDGKFARLPNGQIPVHRSRYAAALWMRKLCSEPIVKKRPRFLSSIPNLFGRSLTAASIRTVEEIGVIEIREECWFAFLDHFSIQWIEELGDDPHLDAYRLRNINPHSEEKRESYGSMCDCALNEHIYHLRENISILHDAIASAKRLLDKDVESHSRICDIETFSAWLLKTGE